MFCSVLLCSENFCSSYFRAAVSPEGARCNSVSLLGCSHDSISAFSVLSCSYGSLTRSRFARELTVLLFADRLSRFPASSRICADSVSACDPVSAHELSCPLDVGEFGTGLSVLTCMMGMEYTLCLSLCDERR